jgi:hypothetical protein
MTNYILHNWLRIQKDFTAAQYGMLTTIGPNFRVANKTFAVCQCKCGSYGVYWTGSLRYGHTKSCGCQRQANVLKAIHKHGESGKNKTPEYATWAHIQYRCYCDTYTAYKDYGGRGIRVCDRWRDPVQGYANFLEDMGRKPSPSHTIDRYPDPDGNYEPGNCRWATKEQQARNRRGNKPIRVFGAVKLLVEWAEAYNMPPDLVGRRINKGWSPEKALTTPKRKR